MASREDFIEYANQFEDEIVHRPRRALSDDKLIEDALSVMDKEDDFLAALSPVEWHIKGKQDEDDPYVSLVLTSRGIHLIPNLWNMESAMGKFIQKMAIGDGEPFLIEWADLKGTVDEEYTFFGAKFSFAKKFRGGNTDMFAFTYGALRSHSPPAKLFIDIFKEAFNVASKINAEEERREIEAHVSGSLGQDNSSSLATHEEIELLERLSQLLEKGLISKDEFEMKKREIFRL